MTELLARGAYINDFLLAEILEIVEGSPKLPKEFDIINCKLSRQPEKIGLALLKLSELITELLDVGLKRFNGSVLLLPTSLELRFDCISLGSGLIEEGLKTCVFFLGFHKTLQLAE